ncbi:hypothetical protein KDD30_22035 (plasmid) [Photobacterium sp. GJ3]|uniref:hypothetical protein n=1 Tax=Photobacterium sp. GJ3 TaxID=2829502 RepID=UPI001B8AF5C1|nr:hypothetical protein [Photobacterium sp. GJ3]QUJ69441.1 hypothetical protein KDD30_22035 [Photobacterium sp. GJ3]
MSGSALADDWSEWAIDPITTGTDSKVWGSNAEATGDYATAWGYGAATVGFRFLILGIDSSTWLKRLNHASLPEDHSGWLAKSNLSAQG